MEDCRDFNVDDMRLSHESSTEWKLRREFLLTHHEKFPHNRLLCLASCFVNVECYGCRYPGPVMVQLEELAGELNEEVQEHRNAIKQRNEVKFVKSGECTTPKSSDQVKPTRTMNFVKAGTGGAGAAPKSSGGMRFVKASEDYKSVVDRPRTVQPTQTPNFSGQASHRRGRKRSHNNPQSTSLEDILILEPRGKTESVNATSILHQSAAFNHVPLDFVFRKEAVRGGDVETKCQVVLCGRVITESNGATQQLAKSTACQLALKKLKKTNYTIQIKQSADTDASGITREELLGEMQASGAIPDSNIGNKLLKMMGWSGGGVGKKGQGIAEPVSAAGVVNREGLGLQAEKGIGRDFLPKIMKIVQEYMRSNQQDDLRFSPDFTKEERALIHRECQKLGLKSHSHGGADTRFLVVSRKRSANQLLSHVLQSGGETSKYVLIPPGQMC